MSGDEPKKKDDTPSEPTAKFPAGHPATDASKHPSDNTTTGPNTNFTINLLSEVANHSLQSFQSTLDWFADAAKRGLPTFLPDCHFGGTGSVEPLVASSGQQLANMPDRGVYRDGHSQEIDRLKKQWPSMDDASRTQHLADLVHRYDDKSTPFAEKVAIARGLLVLCDPEPGSDGVLKFTAREVEGKSKPLTARGLQAFIANSPEELAKQAKATDIATARQTDSHYGHTNDFVAHLAAVFRTNDKSVTAQASKHEAALALGHIFRNERDGSLSEIPIHDYIVTGRPHRTVGIRSDISESVSKYLATCSDGLLSDTAAALQAPPDGKRLQHLVSRATTVFLDAPNDRFEDKTEAAVAMLAMGTRADGSISDQVGARTIHFPDKYGHVGSGRQTTYKVTEPAHDVTDAVTREQAVKYLKEQTGETAPARVRLIASDALAQAKLITPEEHNKILAGIAGDINAPENVVAHVRARLGLDKEAEESARAADGRVASRDVDSIPFAMTKAQEAAARLTLQQLQEYPELAKLIKPQTLQEMNKEVKEGRFGPASREVYNTFSRFANELTTDLASVHASYGHIPEGCPIQVPTDKQSGRAMSTDLFRAELQAGHVRLELPEAVQPSEGKPIPDNAKPDWERLSKAFKWCEFATGELSKAELRMEMKQGDDFIDTVDPSGRLHSWKSKEGMTEKELISLQAHRAGWLELGLQLRGYATSIAYFNKATQDTHDAWRPSFATYGVLSDEALKDGVFPGHVERENGRIKWLRMDLPETLDPTDTTNLKKIQKITAWLEKYAPQVDQLSQEIATRSGAPLLWENQPAEGKDPTTGEEYNQIRCRFTCEPVRVKLPDGSLVERYKVVSERQKAYATWASYGGEGVVNNVGQPERSGAVVVNNTPIDYNNTNGTPITVQGKQVLVRADESGLVFIKGRPDMYINGQQVGEEHKDNWVEVTPGAKVTVGGPPPEALALSINSDGQVLFKGQKLPEGQSVAIGVNGEAASETNKPAVLVRGNGYGQCEVQSQTGVLYINGSEVKSEPGAWVLVGPQDKVTLTATPGELKIDSDVRLYKADDWATVWLDNKAQVMQAKDLSTWGAEAATFHYVGIGASAALDVLMLTTGTIELRGLKMLAEEGAATAAKVTMRRLLLTEGKRAMWHTFLGASGLAGQAIHNAGGAKFNELRGYAMMTQLAIDGPLGDCGKAIGLLKKAQTASRITGQIEKMGAGWSGTYKGAQWAFKWPMNAYFGADIGLRQSRGWYQGATEQAAHSEESLQDGAASRGSRYESGTSQPLASVARILQFRSDKTAQEVIAEVERAGKMTKKDVDPKQKDVDPKQREDYCTRLAEQYLSPSSSPDQKLAAAAGLIAVHQGDGTTPEILGRRWKDGNSLQEDVTMTMVQAYLKSQTPVAISSSDKGVIRALAELETSLQQVAPAKSEQYLLDEFVKAGDPCRKTAVAVKLMTMHESDNALSGDRVLGNATTADGRQLPVHSKEIRDAVDGAQSLAINHDIQRYFSAFEGAGKPAQQVLTKVKGAFSLPKDSAERKTQMEELQDIFQESTDAESRACAGLGLIYLSADPNNGAIPEEVSYKTTEGWETTRNAYGDEDDRWVDILSPLKNSEIFAYLNQNMLDFAPGIRLAAGDLLYTTGQLNARESTPLAERSGSLLSVLNDPKATTQQKQEAIISSRGDGLSDIMAKLRYQIEPMLAQQSRTASRLQMAALYGRDSTAIDAALKKLEQGSGADTDPQTLDLHALAAAIRQANNEPDQTKREKALSDIESKFETSRQQPGSFYHDFFQAQADKVTGKTDLSQLSNDEQRAERFNAALTLYEAGNADEFLKGNDIQPRALLAKTFISAFNSNQPEMARKILEPLADCLNQLDDTQRNSISGDISQCSRLLAGVLRRVPEQINRVTRQIDPDYADAIRLKRDALSYYDKFESGLKDTSFGADTRKLLLASVTPPADSSKFEPDEEFRIAAIKMLAKDGANSSESKDFLLRVTTGEQSDPSARVRSAAFDMLREKDQSGLHQQCTGLLKSERDAGMLEKVQTTERSTEYRDPDPKLYQERYRESLRKLYEASSHPLSSAERYLKQHHPLLTGNRDDEILSRVKKSYTGVGGNISAVWNWSWGSLGESVVETKNTVANDVSKDMFKQLNDLVTEASTPGGEEARRGLAWIVMSNAKSFNAQDQQKVMAKAADAMAGLCRSDDATVRAGVAPLITICLASQDRMSPEARQKLLGGMMDLHPGAKDSPISAEDARTAILAAIERQFHCTPRRQDSVPDLFRKQNQDLQLSLLDAYAQFAGPEAIPVLEAMTEERMAFKVERGSNGRVKRAEYPDRSWREVEEDANQRVWQETIALSNGTRQVWVREGTSDKWYEKGDTKKEHPIFRTVAFDQQTGNFCETDRYGKETITTPSQATIISNKGKVTDVYRPDHSHDHVDVDGTLTRTGPDGKWASWSNSLGFSIDSKTGDVNTHKTEYEFRPGAHISRNWAPGHRTAHQVTSSQAPDGALTVWRDGKLHLSKPGVADQSPESIPAVRQKASQLLGKLRDSTELLQSSAALDRSKSPDALSRELQQVADNQKSTTEDVSKAIFTDGLSRPIEKSEDPRRPILLRLLNDSDERVRLSAAHVLFTSEVKEDRSEAGKVIADLSKNGSRQGYRDDASQFISFVGKNPDKFHQGEDAAVLQKLVDSTVYAPHTEKTQIRPQIERTLSSQRRYEEAKEALIRDAQIDLVKFTSSQWWKDSKYPLLWEESLREHEGDQVKQASRGDSWQVTAGDEQVIKKLSQASIDERDKQFAGLCEATKEISSKDPVKAQKARDACSALAYLAMSNGSPLAIHASYMSSNAPADRQSLALKAAKALSNIYNEGGIGRTCVEPFMKAALVSNPGIDSQVRMNFASTIAHCALNPEATDHTAPSKADASMLLIAAMEAEELSGDTQDSHDNQNQILGYLEQLDEPIVMPALQAISERHPSEEIAFRAQFLFERLRDDTELLQAKTVSSQGDPQKLAVELAAKLKASTSQISEEELCREIFRLSGRQPAESSPKNPGDDPRIPVLHEALNHANERIRLTAAHALKALDPADPAPLRTAIQLIASQRGRLAEESFRMIKTMPVHQPIDSINDPRRQMLLDTMNKGTQIEQLAASWALSQSQVKGDFETATAKLAYLTVNGEGSVKFDGVQRGVPQLACGLLTDMINHGGDEHQRVALDRWQYEWKQRKPGTPEDVKPPTPGEIDQARKYIRSLSASQSEKLWSSLQDARGMAVALYLDKSMGLPGLAARLQPPPLMDPHDNYDEYMDFWRNGGLPISAESFFQRGYPGDTYAGNQFNQPPAQDYLPFNQFADGMVRDSNLNFDEKIPVKDLSERYLRAIYGEHGKKLRPDLKAQFEPQQLMRTLAQMQYVSQNELSANSGGRLFNPYHPYKPYRVPTWQEYQKRSADYSTTQLRKMLEAQLTTPNADAHVMSWRPHEAITVTPPKFLAKPPVDLLDARGGYLGQMLPTDLPVDADSTISVAGLRKYIEAARQRSASAAGKPGR